MLRRVRRVVSSDEEEVDEVEAMDTMEAQEGFKLSKSAPLGLLDGPRDAHDGTRSNGIGL